MAWDSKSSRRRQNGDATRPPTSTTPNALNGAKSPHVADPTLQPFLNPSFDPADYLNDTLPPLQSSNISQSTRGSVPLAELSTQTQTLLSQLSAHTTRLTTTLTQLTDEILRSGSRLAYEVEVLRGETLGLSEALTEGLQEDIVKFVPGGLEAETRRRQPWTTETTGHRSRSSTNTLPKPLIVEEEPKPEIMDPPYITQLRTLTLVRSRLDLVIKTFGDAMAWTFPPSEVSVSSSFLSVSAPEPGSDKHSIEEKGQQVSKQLRDEIADLLTGKDPVEAIEAAAKRVEELKELVVVWKGTAEEKARVKFVENLAKMVEDRHRDLLREAEQDSRLSQRMETLQEVEVNAAEISDFIDCEVLDLQITISKPSSEEEPEALPRCSTGIKSAPAKKVAVHVFNNLLRPIRLRGRTLLLVITITGIISLVLARQHAAEIKRTAVHLSTYVPTKITDALGQYLEFENTRWTDDPNALGSSIQTIKPKFHLLIRATKPTANLCKTVLSAAILNYPQPTLLGYMQPNTESSAHDLINSIWKFLRGKEVEENDFVLIVDEDTWFQLPTEVLINRFLSNIKEIDTKLSQTYGIFDPKNSTTPTTTPQKYTHHILFSAQKHCSSTPPDTCNFIPESPLPRYIFGSQTDHDMDPKYNRPRYLSSSFIFGRASHLRPLHDRAREISKNNKASSQEIFTQIFHLQESARSEYLSVIHPPSSKWSALLAQKLGLNFTLRRSDPAPPVNPLNKYVDTTGNQDHEFGISLDYTSNIFQTMNNSIEDIQAIKFSHPIAITSSSRIATKVNHFSLPMDLSSSTPPFSGLESPSASEAQGIKKLYTYPKGKQPWKNVSLLCNIIIPGSTVPAVMNWAGIGAGGKEREEYWTREEIWDVKSGKKGGVWTEDGKWIGWKEPSPEKKIPLNHPPPAAPSGPQYRVLYDFNGQSETELSIKKSELLTVLQKAENGWWLAKSSSVAARPIPPPPPAAARPNGANGSAARAKPTPPTPPAKRPAASRKPASPSAPRDSGMSMNSGSGTDSGRNTPTPSLAGGLAEALRARQSALQKGRDEDDDW
ncbi:hypothetical protein B7494_g1556 [Chlorociboria aeruginascens]|nr:hypothetical protein B7494_g1556 [Chlorociboria aeruginascens]